MTDRIMYVCETCKDHDPDSCGHFDRTEVRVTSDGKWLCYSCYDNDAPSDAPAWDTLPPATEYAPLTALLEQQ